MNNSKQYYKSSNKVNLIGILLFFLVSLIGGTILSFIYLYLVRLVPLVMFKVLFCVFFAIFLAFLFTFALKVGKIRNRVVAFLLVLTSIILVNYIKWVIFVVVILNYNNFSSVINPAVLWNDILNLNAVGTYINASNQIPVTGLRLALTWIIELIVITLPSFFAIRITEKPFSEESRRWMEEVELDKQLKLVEDMELQSFITALEHQDCSVILERQKFEHPQAMCTYVKLFKADSQNSGFIEVWNKKPGKVIRVIKPIMIGKDNANKIENYLM